MRAFLINLERNDLRLAAASKQLTANAVVFERFPAVDGRAMTSENRRRHVAELRARMARLNKLMPGEVGCALSHMFIFRKMIDEHISAALIFEDDVMLSTMFQEALKTVQMSMDITRAQVFLFSGAATGDLNPEGSDTPKVVAVKTALLADAYVITRVAAQRIFGVNYPLVTMNDWWGRWRQRGLIELYRVIPACSAQRQKEFGSDVTPNKHPPLRGFRWLCWKAARAPCVVIDWAIWLFVQK